MANYPIDRMTRNRTLADEIYAIVYKYVDKRVVKPTEKIRDTNVYADNTPGSGAINTDWDAVVTSTNIGIVGLTNDDRGGIDWPTPSTIVTVNGNLVTIG